MRSFKFILFFAFCLTLPSELLFSQADLSSQKQTMQMELYEAADIPHITGYGNCQWLYPLDKPKEALLSQPEYKSSKLYYYAAKYGDSDDNIHTIILDESQGTGKGYDTVYVDVDNDNRIDSDTEKFSFEMSTTSIERPLRMKIMVSASGKKIRYYFNFTAFPYTDENNPGNKIHANARNSSMFVGRANFNGNTYKIGIADLNSNGLFNDVEQGLFKGDRFFVDFDSDGRFHDSRGAEQESFSYGRYTKIAGNWYTIKADPSGTSIEISRAAPDIVTLQAPKVVGTVDLHSAVQSLHLSFSDGAAEAVVGTYRLAEIGLSMPDSQNRKWTARGRFREDPLEVNLKHGDDTVLPEVLPLSVSIEPAAKSPFEEVSFSAKIVSPIGGAFLTPRATGQPNGGFEVQDADGKMVASEAFKYG